MGQHADVRPRRLLVAVVLGSLPAAGCGPFDEAALVDPGAATVEAEPGQLRVLHHRDDPTAGDDWRDVLSADPGVVVATERFREADSRDADDDEPADVRLLYEAVAEGRTVLVQLNCRSCDDGVPSTAPEDTEVLVWDFVVGGADDAPPSLGRGAARVGRPHGAAVGDHVVIVRPPGSVGEARDVDGDVLRLVARHEPSDGADLVVDVFAAVAAGETRLAYGSDEYLIRVA